MQILCIPRSGLKLPKIPILAASVTSMQFWRHILRRVPKPDNSYGGREKNGQSWWPMNSMHRWCKPVPKIWELRCNSMQWRFFLYLRLSFHRILRFVVFIVSSCHLRLCFSSDSIQTNPNLGPNPTSPSIDIDHLPCHQLLQVFTKHFVPLCGGFPALKHLQSIVTT